MNKVSKFFMLVLCLATVRYMVLAYQENRSYVEAKKECIELQNLVIEDEAEEAQIDFESLRKINPDICASVSYTHLIKRNLSQLNHLLQ